MFPVSAYFCRSPMGLYGLLAVLSSGYCLQFSDPRSAFETHTCTRAENSAVVVPPTFVGFSADEPRPENAARLPLLRNPSEKPFWRLLSSPDQRHCRFSLAPHSE